MSTLRLCVRDDRWTEKGNKIQIALAHRGSTVYIPTTVKLTSRKQWRDGRVVQHEDANKLNRELRLLLCDYEQRLDGVTHIDRYSCRQLRDIILEKTSIAELRTYADVLKQYIDELREDGRAGYARILEFDGARFSKCMGDVPIDCISPKMINDYCRWLMRKGLSPATVGMSLRCVKTVINRAIRLQYVTYDVHPFLGVKIPTGGIREIDIDIEALLRIRDAEIEKPRLRMVRDLFMLSFYCAGVNLVDIMHADWRGERLEYVREKTKLKSQQKVSIIIVPEARAIVDKYIGADGRLSFGYKYTDLNFRHYVSSLFRELMKIIGIEGAVMYSARKTWAQIAMDIGVGESVIDYCLGHSDSKRGIIRYYTKVRAKMADEAVRSVIEVVNGELSSNS